MQDNTQTPTVTDPNLTPVPAQTPAPTTVAETAPVSPSMDVVKPVAEVAPVVTSAVEPEVKPDVIPVDQVGETGVKVELPVTPGSTPTV